MEAWFYNVEDFTKDLIHTAVSGTASIKTNGNWAGQTQGFKTNLSWFRVYF